MSGRPEILLEACELKLAIGARVLCEALSLRVHAGQFVVLLGPNGAGKTTLLHALAGLHQARAGSVSLAGRSYLERAPRENALIRALLPQTQPDHFAASALETVLVGRHPHLGRWAWESPEDLAIAHRAMSALGIGSMAARDTLSLSGGERQRVALAALLAQEPRLFLLDEPLNHLDLHHQIRTLELFRGLAGQGRAVVMVLHDINLAARYADHVVVLDGRGASIAGAATEVLTEAVLSKAFGHPLRRHEVDGHLTFIPR